VFLGVVFLLASVVFAWLVRDEAPVAPAAAEGAALYDRYCARCHDAADLSGPLRAGGAATRVAWETLLLDHGRSSTAEDRLILDYLAQR